MDRLHPKSGKRWNVRPGHRSAKIVTIMFSAAKIDEKPSTVRPRIQKSWPWPFEYSAVESGTYDVQPADGSSPNAKLEYRTIAPATRSQYESALRRGKAMSRAPIISGMT